jgi:Raf kinase inhibitor-like YbhB/YbcL family protein
MDLTSSSITEGTPIPGEFAFGIPDEKSHLVFGANRNPALSWSGVPDGTLSLALICYDPDVPTKPDDVNQEGREVPDDLPRTDFFHWVVADLGADLRSIDAGSFSDGVVPRGKGQDHAPVPCRLGANDYTGWFAGDPDMEGQYFGYDGPCPPWNDSLIHHYIFTVFALDVPTLDLPDVFNGDDLRRALDGHILDSASMMGTYTLNPRLAS